MYSTCIFCNSALGKNQVLEHFPVGRRLAFDAAKGRLWVVCPRCERWNLTPLEARWEAIEEAERAFRGMRLRVSTDNIGLARLREGLELVRIGTPLLPEVAAWRYGDQFGRRRRKHLIVAGAGITVGLAAPFVPLLVGVTSVVAAMNAAQLSLSLALRIRMRRESNHVCATVRDDTGQSIPLTAENIRSAALVRAANGDDNWHLALPHGQFLAEEVRYKTMNRRGGRGIAAGFAEYAQLTGDTATRALATMLPQLNVHGAKPRIVRGAVDAVNASPDAGHLLREIAARPRIKQFGVKEGETYMTSLPPNIRLALEIMLHQDDERRAMEGELRELEQRWRDADAIASIADSLTLPPDIDDRLAALR
jgi:hypothetical protein